MSEMTLADLLSLASDLGVIGLLFLGMWGGAKAFWVFGWSHRESIADLRAQLQEAEKRHTKREEELKSEIKEWKIMAISATDIGKRVANVAEKSVSQ